MDLSKIYTELVLEQSRNKKNKRELEEPTHTELGHNPSCGDEITLQLRVVKDVIEDVAFTGQGCAISQASTSIMCDTVRGKTTEEALDLAHRFIGMINGQEKDRKRLRVLGDARAFESIKNLPARVKCAVLAWYTLKDMIENDRKEGSFRVDE